MLKDQNTFKEYEINKKKNFVKRWRYLWVNDLILFYSKGKKYFLTIFLKWKDGNNFG